MSARILKGDVLSFARHYKGPKFHALLCDPPYGLGFMGVGWDTFKDRKGEAGKIDGLRWDDVGGNNHPRKSVEKQGILYRQNVKMQAKFTAYFSAFMDLLLPGAFGMAFASSRGYHRMACAIEDAGFILHPSIFLWIYASGFPKSTRIYTQIDAAAGAEREIIGKRVYAGRHVQNSSEEYLNPPIGTFKRPQDDRLETLPATDLARIWQSHRYGMQALKPAAEPIIVFQKPYEGRPVDSIVNHGAGALNIDSGRISTTPAERDEMLEMSRGFEGQKMGRPELMNYGYEKSMPIKLVSIPSNLGRWPANFALCHLPECKLVGTRTVRGDQRDINDPGRRDGGFADVGADNGDGVPNAQVYGNETVEAWECAEGCPVAALDRQAGERSSGQLLTHHKRGGQSQLGTFNIRDRSGEECNFGGDTGGGSRFFHNAHWNYEVQERLDARDPVRYEPKADSTERAAGLPQRSNHPTMKPIELARWLSSLLLPPKEYAPRRILIPFAGVASEMVGCLQAGWDEIVGVEKEAEYVAIARQRLAYWERNPYREPERRPEVDPDQMALF